MQSFREGNSLTTETEAGELSTGDSEQLGSRGDLHKFISTNHQITGVPKLTFFRRYQAVKSLRV